MKRFLSVLLVLSMLTSFLLPASAASEDSVIQTVGLLGILNGNASGELNLGSNVTRAEFTKMVIAASPMRDLTSATSASAPFPDVRRSHWAAGYVSAAVNADLVNGYLDGKFRPDNPVKMEEAVNIVLKLLGYSASDFSGTYPEAQINKYHALKLDENVTAEKGNYMTRRDCMYLIYNALNATNKEGRVHCTTLGYALGKDGKLDTAALLNDTVSGPVIVRNSDWQSEVGFDVTKATVFKNDVKTNAAAITVDDVVYYSKELRTLWVYAQKAHGTLEAASPNLIAPTSVTVSGKTYSLTGDGSYALSNFGGIKLGDTVTLLLGKDGSVVGTASGSAVSGEVFGVITGISVKQFTDSNGAESSAKVVTVLDTDGMTGEYRYDSKYLSVGDVVRVSVGASVSITKLTTRRLTGVVNASGNRIGALDFADDIKILDVCEGRGLRVYGNRIANITLKEGDVIWYNTNASGEITHLLLDDVTGDLREYGIITAIATGGNDAATSKSYTCIINGTKRVITNATASQEIKQGGCSVVTAADGKVKLENLKQTLLRAVSETTAQASNTSYRVANSVVVYEVKDGEYLVSSIAAIADGTYDLTGFYDSDGLIRIIIAK